jgi:hypothetical protein
MLKQSTGEPYAGEPHVRFGGKGETSSLPLSNSTDPKHHSKRIARTVFSILHPNPELPNG